MTVEGVDRFGLVASAIAGRTVDVVGAAPGEGAWTDGQRIVVDPGQSRTELLRSLSVQACLLAAGSLAPDVIANLVGRPRVSRRYLAVEGWRALGLQSELLPPQVVPRASESTSARHSLAIAKSRVPLTDPPDWFGSLRPRVIRAQHGTTSPGPGASEAWHEPRRADPDSLRALDDGGDDDRATNLLSSPVGGGGGIGRLLSRLLSDARGSGGGPPGSDSPTRFSAVDNGGGGVRSTFALPGRGLEDARGTRLETGTTYPEWDVHRHRYRAAWCTVRELPLTKSSPQIPPIPDPMALRRALAHVGLSMRRVGRQREGIDIDIDAAVENHVNARAGQPADDSMYIDLRRRRRDLAVLILLDVSGSAGEPGARGQTVHVHQQATAARLLLALHELGARSALYGFRSQGRSAVHILPMKRFEEPLQRDVWEALWSCTPRAYTRLGAAIRHGTRTLERDASSTGRVLVVISDGFAYDHGYEGLYGRGDARRALTEARRRGIGCICLSMGAATEVTELRQVFGTAAHAALDRVEQLPLVIAPMFRLALRSAAAQRRAAQSRTRVRRQHEARGDPS